MNRRNLATIIVIAILLAYPTMRLLIRLTATPPPNVGSGTLDDCPASPNCVSSLAAPSDDLHYIEPLTYTGTQADTQSALIAALEELPRTTMLKVNLGYVHAQRVSPMMGFPDDLEFVFDDENKVINVRSAARLGQADMGKNREHIELIRAALAD